MGPDNGMKFFTSREISSSSGPHLSSQCSLSRETFLTALAALAGGDPQRAHSYSLYTVVYLISVQYYTKSYSISLQTLSHDIHNIYTCTTCTTCSCTTCTTCSCTTYTTYTYACTLAFLWYLHSLHTLALHILTLHTLTLHTLFLGLHYVFCINNKYCNLLYN